MSDPKRLLDGPLTDDEKRALAAAEGNQLAPRLDIAAGDLWALHYQLTFLDDGACAPKEIAAGAERTPVTIVQVAHRERAGGLRHPPAV